MSWAVKFMLVFEGILLLVARGEQVHVIVHPVFVLVCVKRNVVFGWSGQVNLYTLKLKGIFLSQSHLP